MLKKTPDPELARVVDKSLELRIDDFRRELEMFVNERAMEIKNSSTGEGLPLQSILLMLTAGSQCQCHAALKVISDRKRIWKLNNDRRYQQRDPHGLLYLLDPDWADLIEQEHEFDKKVTQAAKAHRFYFQECPTLQ
jgi:hypothetical protein